VREIIALVPDAYGGRGGIAHYLRNVIQAACEWDGADKVVALPRHVPYDLEQLPPKLEFISKAARGKLGYATEVGAQALSGSPTLAVLCGHLHLLPFAVALGARRRAPVVPFIYGFEAWAPTSHRTANFLCRYPSRYLSIRDYTSDRFSAWSGVPRNRIDLMPNCIDPAAFTPGPAPPRLIEKYGLQGKRVILTVGRLDTEDREQRKGFDEVIEALPAIARSVPEAIYLVMGDGQDRGRLEAKARDLGVGDKVVFSGYIPEAEKAEHYRLGHVLAMPGSGRDFDTYPYRFAFLEALACGCRVVAARATAEEQKDPRVSKLLVQVDPTDTAATAAAIAAELRAPKRPVPSELSDFYYPSFREHLHGVLASVSHGTN
jgi:glycosyltransferase involved in cell wall biosynthesis